MPDKPTGQLLREYGEQAAKAAQKLEHLQQNIDRVELGLLELETSHRSLDKQFALKGRDLEKLANGSTICSSAVGNTPGSSSRPS